MSFTRCFACDKAITRYPPSLADTRDGQLVYVGPDCFQRIKAAGRDGYQPPKGGPRLWTLPPVTRQEGVSADAGVCATKDPFDAQPVEVTFGTPVRCTVHAERACLCVVTPCPCPCHRVEAEPVHAVGCACGSCSAAYVRDAWDPRMGVK